MTTIMQPPAPPEAPPQAAPQAPARPPKRHWGKLAAAAAAAVLAIGGISAGVSAAMSGSQPAATKPSTPVATAPAAPAAPVYDDAGFIEAVAGTDAQAVINDLSTMAADAGRYDLAAVQADGTQLSTDAGIWYATMDATSPSPQYQPAKSLMLQAIRHTQRAGDLAAQGDLNGATSELDAATADLDAANRALPGGTTVPSL